MSTQKSYNNTITENEVSLAIEQVLIATSGTSWTPGRVDVGSPPSGFTHLGAVVEDTPSLQVTREKFRLQTGIPKVIQYQAIIGLTGRFEAQLHSNAWDKWAYAFGNYTVGTSGAMIRQPYGTALMSTYFILGVADFINGVQVVHAMYKVAPTDEMREEIRPATNPHCPLSFEALGIRASTVSVSYGTSDELIIGERFYFPAGV